MAYVESLSLATSSIRNFKGTGAGIFVGLVIWFGTRNPRRMAAFLGEA